MINHLSYSSISAYHLCPSAWKRRYIDKVQTPTATALVFGGAFHDTIEAFIEARALGQDANLPDLWAAKWADKLAREREIDWGDDNADDLQALGLRMLGKLAVSGSGPNRTETAAQFLGKIMPRMNGDKPEIERKVSLSVPGVPVPVIGYIDIVTVDGIPGDFKTAARAWYADKAHSELQPTFYLAALAQMGEPVPDGKFRYYCFTKTKSPKAQILETKRTAAEMLWLFELIRETWQAIKAGVFPPCPVTWKCSPKYCDYWPQCRGRF